jgi:hypothetical protein
MRPFIIGAMAVTLAGCTWTVPQPAQQLELLSYGATETAITAQKGDSRHWRKAHSRRKIANSNTNIASRVQPAEKSAASINAKSTVVAAKTETRQSSQPESASNTSTSAKSAMTAKPEIPPSPQRDDKFDPVIKKAIPTIVAKMEDSASVELVEMKRAEKNASGKSIDTICGYVRGKSASGAETGDRPFLYLVYENQAYIGGYDMATSPYHDLCRQ